MRVDGKGQRFYTNDDVNHERVRLAMAEVGRGIELERLAGVYAEHQEIRARGGHVCDAVDWRTGKRCEWEARHLYVCGWRCQHHTPAAQAGHPEPAPACNAPVRCYCTKCLSSDGARAAA